MRIPLRISTYISKHFIQNLLLVTAILASLIFVIEILELTRKAYNKTIPFAIIFEMALLKFPISLQKFLPFSALVASVLTYTKLTRTNELIVTRAAGISAWQFLLPSILTAIIAGALIIAILNPIFCAMLSRYEKIEDKYISGRSNLLAISSSGLWLRQKNNFSEDGETIIHALKASKENLSLSEVIIFEFGEKDKFIKRIDAESAKLGEGVWNLKNVILSYPNKPATRLAEYSLPTELTVMQIQDSFASPETISFWALPAFIKTLRESGFPAQQHLMQYYNVLFSPLLLASMVLIASAFALRNPRQGRITIMIALCVSLGFVIYFFTDVISALAVSGRFAIEFAAIAPIIINFIIGAGIILHLEDG